MSRRDDAPPPIPRSEWAVAAIGLCLVTGCVGFLIYTALAREATPPDVVVSIQEHRAVEAGHLVRFEARNRGGSPAVDVVILGELADASGAVAETSELTLDFLPSDSARSGGLYFRGNPAEGKLSIHAVSYQDP